MNGEAGKGSKLRIGADMRKFYSNYDDIFRKPVTQKVEIESPANKSLDEVKQDNPNTRS